MGWLTNLVKAAAPIARVVPGLNTIVGGVALATTVYGAGRALLGGSSSSGSMPAPPPAPGTTGGFGLPRGAGGGLQLPWNDPSIPADQKPHAIDDQYLKQTLRAPHGFVVGFDPSGKAFGLERKWALHNSYYHRDGHYGPFKPAHKPPISVGTWHAVKKSHGAYKKIKKINRMMARISRFAKVHHEHDGKKKGK